MLRDESAETAFILLPTSDRTHTISNSHRNGSRQGGAWVGAWAGEPITAQDDDLEDGSQDFHPTYYLHILLHVQMMLFVNLAIWISVFYSQLKNIQISNVDLAALVHRTTIKKLSEGNRTFKNFAIYYVLNYYALCSCADRASCTCHVQGHLIILIL